MCVCVSVVGRAVASVRLLFFPLEIARRFNRRGLRLGIRFRWTGDGDGLHHPYRVVPSFFLFCPSNDADWSPTWPMAARGARVVYFRGRRFPGVHNEPTATYNSNNSNNNNNNKVAAGADKRRRPASTSGRSDTVAASSQKKRNDKEKNVEIDNRKKTRI